MSDERLELGDERAIYTDDGGTMRFEHRCSRANRLDDPGEPLLIAPAITLHVIKGPMEHLTITPSILCTDCGTHGFVTDGEWRST